MVSSLTAGSLADAVQAAARRPPPLGDLVDVGGVDGQHLAWVGLGDHLLGEIGLHHRHGQVITGEGDVDGVLEQVGLGAERGVQGLHGDLRLGGDLGQGGCGVPVTGEQSRSGVDDPLLVLAGLGLAAGPRCSAS